MSNLLEPTRAEINIRGTLNLIICNGYDTLHLNVTDVIEVLKIIADLRAKVKDYQSVKVERILYE